jgi:hypothetical protein
LRRRRLGDRSDLVVFAEITAEREIDVAKLVEPKDRKLDLVVRLFLAEVGLQERLAGAR